MQWAACQGRHNSRERARQSCIHSQFSPISVVFKVSNVFFLHYCWLLREQLFPSLLPIRITIPTLTGRQLMGKLTACMRRSNSWMKLMCCIRRGWGGGGGGPKDGGGGGGPGSCRVWGRDRGGKSFGLRWETDPSWVYLFIHLFIQPPPPDTTVGFLAADFKLAALHSQKLKTLRNHRCSSPVWRETLRTDTMTATPVKCDIFHQRGAGSVSLL